MRVVCNLAKVMDEAGIRAVDLRHTLGVNIDWRTVDKICGGAVDWRLDRDQLFGLLVLADELGVKLFELEAPDIWQTFEHGKAVVFRCDGNMDATIEAQVRKFFARIGCTAEVLINNTDPEVIRKAIASANCLVIGSPIRNPSAEIALATLWGVEPFDSTDSNKKRIPVQFVGRPPMDGRGSAFVISAPSNLITIRTPKAIQRFEVDWFETDKPGRGIDAALVVAQRRKTLDDRLVTTVVIGGYRGEGTQVAAEALTRDELPINADALSLAEPALAVYSYKFKKRVPHAGLPLALPTAGSGKWAPPWGNRVKK